MAATGFTPVFIYASGTTGNIPSASNLNNTSNGSEIALNYFDGKLFYKNSSNSVVTVPLLQSSGSQNGWLSSTDWTTFNNKQPAGTYVTSVTGTAPVVSSGGTTPAISMAAATSAVNGYLTSTDWSTFNGKQAALVSGTNIKTVNGTSLLGSGDVGTIAIGYGGTGLTSFTANQIHYGSFSQSSGLTFDGTNFATTGTASAKSFIPTSSTVPTNGLYYPGTNKIGWATNSTFGFLLDDTQSLCIGDAGNFGAKVNIAFDPSATNGLLFAVSSGTFTNNYVYFQNSGGSKIGSISSNNSAVAYNTTSDYRVKENIQPIKNAISKVKQLNPVSYDWKPEFAVGSGQGFIAHELQQVVPEAVNGEKDAVDKNGNPKYQGIDTSFVIPMLTAAIKEQQKIIESLQARLDAANI